MERTIDKKLTAIKTCKSNIKDRINSIYGGTIVDDKTTFEDYASKLGDIEGVKQELMKAINKTLEGGLTEETQFSSYPDAIYNYNPPSEFNILHVTWKSVPGVKVTFEPEKGFVTSGSIIKATYKLEDNYKFIKWGQNPLFTIDNNGFFKIESNMEITLDCKEKREVYTFNCDSVNEINDLNENKTNILSDKYRDSITCFSDILVGEQFDGNKECSKKVLAIIIPEDTSLLHVIDNANIDWCDKSKQLIKKIEFQLTINDKKYDVYYYCGEDSISSSDSAPLKITITSKK